MLYTGDLRQAIEELYRAFRRYELREDTQACSCHHSEEDERRIHRGPLNTLSHADLRQYAQDAIYIWGNGDDFKHFIPRLFELLAQPEAGCGFPHAAEVLRKLTYESWCSTHWRSWPEQEQKAIAKYLLTVWDAALDSDPDNLAFEGAFGWLEAIAQAEHELAPYLDRWLNSPSLNAHRNLALTITDNGLPSVKIHNGVYWTGHREQWQQLNDWLRRPEVRDKLIRGFDQWTDLPIAGELMDAAVLLP